MQDIPLVSVERQGQHAFGVLYNKNKVHSISDTKEGGGLCLH